MAENTRVMVLEIVGFSFEGTACDGETMPSEDAPRPPYT